MIKYILLIAHPNIWFGIFLIIINFPLGWAGLFWFIHHAHITKNRVFLVIGVLLYALSWGALIIGIFLVGKDYAKIIFIRYHAYIIVFTVLSVTGLIMLKHYYSKKDLKINTK